MNRPRHLGNPEYRRNPVLGLLQFALCEKNENKQKEWAVVVAQLVEWALPIPWVCGSNPVTGKLLYRTFLSSVPD